MPQTGQQKRLKLANTQTKSLINNNLQFLAKTTKFYSKTKAVIYSKKTPATSAKRISAPVKPTDKKAVENDVK